MWENLPKEQKEEYKRLILSFASLTGMFAQKSTDENSAPIINSKFQETAFQRSFGASAEDIGNTSYDVSLQCNGEKYLIGIKTFGIGSGDQKVAQFKAKHDEWAKTIDGIKSNASGIEDKDTIDCLNHDLYMSLAHRLAKIRNARIDSSCANIKGFVVDSDDKHVHSIYHVLMPSSKNEDAKIYVGETSYDKIDIEKISILGCTGKNNPTNFSFTDGKHVYKYTAADSQLHMNFNNKNIVCEEWPVRYAEDAHAIFGKIADAVYSSEKEDAVAFPDVKSEEEVEETYCWTIWNKDKETELFSGFNSFYGTGSKLGRNQRELRIKKLNTTYATEIDYQILKEVTSGLTKFLLETANTSSEKAQKVRLREYILQLTKKTNNIEFQDEVSKLVFRPVGEMYIPIPDSAQFHKDHPNFFGKNFGLLEEGTAKLQLSKQERKFNLVFEPSGDSLPAYITQDNGKAIESAEKQTYLGEWILRGIFQLEKYEPLTSSKLAELNINGLRFSRYKNSDDIHLEFIWIDEDNPPKGFIPRLK